MNASRASHLKGQRRRDRRAVNPRWHFLRGFLKNPVMVGSVIPSSKILIDTMLTPRNTDWRVAAAFLDLNSFGLVRGIADTPVEKGLAERYAPPGLDVDGTLEPDAAKAAAMLADLLAREPFVWVFLGWRSEERRLDLAPYVSCSWRFGQSRIAIVTRRRASLPRDLQACRAENGSLTAAIRSLYMP